MATMHAKTVYWFKPNFHWNVIKPDVYFELLRFYPEEYFKKTMESTNDIQTNAGP